jgi:purine-binding chemotaxis protein CheW
MATPTVPAPAQWVVFSLDAARYALPLATVERVVRAAELTLLPLAPSVVLGVIDIAGHVLPVFNMRRKFRLPERPLRPSDQFVIAHAAHRTVVLAVDAALGVVERPAADVSEAARLAPDSEHIQGVIRMEDGLVLVHDLDRFLSAQEAGALGRALDGIEAGYAG